MCTCHMLDISYAKGEIVKWVAPYLTITKLPWDATCSSKSLVNQFWCPFLVPETQKDHQVLLVAKCLVGSMPNAWESNFAGKFPISIHFFFFSMRFHSNAHLVRDFPAPHPCPPARTGTSSLEPQQRCDSSWRIYLRYKRPCNSLKQVSRYPHLYIAKD